MKTPKLIISSVLFLFLIFPNVYAQSGYKWEALPNSPSSPIRFDDIYFIDSLNGSICNGTGKVYKTNDGGNSWSLILNRPDVYFRALFMTDPLHIWVGNLGISTTPSDSNAIYHTDDGGLTWDSVRMPELYGSGICGFFNLDDIHFYGVGRVSGPAHFIKSSDGGATWTYKDMTPYCGFLIDCYFQSVDTGFVVGSSSASINTSHPIVLKTTNGGTTWDTVMLALSSISSWCWKISFPSRNTGYVSVESAGSSGMAVHCLVTMDGGNTWSFRNNITGNYRQQGIGFINDSTGWSGGDGQHLYETIDGGLNWAKVSGDVADVNRIRKINDRLMYAAGDKIYKIIPQSIGIRTAEKAAELNWELMQCLQPKCAVVKIKDTDPKKKYILNVYDAGGRLIRKEEWKGEQHTVYLNDVPFSMVYFVLYDGAHYTTRLFLNQ